MKFKIADKVGAYLLCDMAHFSGLVATKQVANPFDYCDVVTSTTHKTLRGPRSGVIFFRKGKRTKFGKVTDEDYNLEEPINFAVFPSCQGGPHENVIAGVAVTMKEAASAEFKEYAIQVKKNAAKLAEELTKKGYDLVTGGTDNHLVLWDLRKLDVTGSKIEKVLELVRYSSSPCFSNNLHISSISANKNAVYGDTSALVPGGVRLGTPALTSRNFKEADFEKVAEYLDRAVKIALSIQAKVGKQMKDFQPAAEANEELKTLKQEVEKFAQGFPMPG